MIKLGLIGKKLGHSFSKRFFENLFFEKQLKGSYELLELSGISEFELLKTKDFTGLNVTIPYKESVIPYLDELDETAAEIGAVNCIKFCKTGNLKGFNTDAIGFKNSLNSVLVDKKIGKALVLGSGGAAKAVCFVLTKMNIDFLIVSRSSKAGQLTYKDLNAKLIEEHKLIINCSPLGMFPAIDGAPEIPYSALGKSHILFDLVYNPEETLFMKKGKEKGAAVCNGLDMLYGQAEAAWKIWTE